MSLKEQFERWYIFQGKSYHEQCYTCADCNESLSGQFVCAAPNDEIVCFGCDTKRKAKKWTTVELDPSLTNISSEGYPDDADVLFDLLLWQYMKVSALCVISSQIVKIWFFPNKTEEFFTNVYSQWEVSNAAPGEVWSSKNLQSHGMSSRNIGFSYMSLTQYHYSPVAPVERKSFNIFF